MDNRSINSKKFLSPIEDRFVLNRIKDDWTRNGIMLKLLRSCGMRAGELLSLRVCDLNQFEKSILVHASKGSNDRELPLDPDLFEHLTNYISSTKRGEYERIFDIGYDQLGIIWRGYRPIGSGKPLHSLRHTLALEVYRRTKDILLVKTILGHKSIQTTMIYQEFCHTQPEIRRALLADSNHGAEPERALASDDNLLRFRNSETGHG